MMGNENSILDESDIEKEYFQVNDWNLHNGKWKATKTKDVRPNTGEEITVFRRNVAHKRDTEIHTNLGTNLKRFRHPGIVKYVASGHKNDDIYVVTERIAPLSKLLKGLCASEICAGLFTVIQALEFCHDKVRHNNFGIDSVFVTIDGTWKIAGLEFLCSREECNEEFLQKNRAFRNEIRIPPEEKEGRFSHLTKHGHAGDVYAVGLFLKDILQYVLKIDDNFPHARQFLDLIRKKVLIADPTLRPIVGSMLKHEFFTNDFLYIVTFLKNLTLKDASDRQEFFSGLTKRLLQLPEPLVAIRLASPLLARFVLLDEFAGRHFLPNFFRPFRGDVRPDVYVDGISNPVLTISSYRAHVIPNLVCIFDVLDFNVRMVLLKNFEHYVDLFDLQVLKCRILPQVLLGIKDTNNDLVIRSLHALAYVVPILGGDVVIGKNRSRYFTEAKPKDVSTRNQSPIVRSSIISNTVHNQLTDVLLTTTNREQVENRLKDTKNTALSKVKPESNELDQPDDDVESIVSVERRPETPELERSSPDGGEASDGDPNAIADCESWSDWECLAEEETIGKNEFESIVPSTTKNILISNPPEELNQSCIHRPVLPKELGGEFDIVAVAIKGGTKEDDFFADMQPVICNRAPSTLDDVISMKNESAMNVVVNKRLSYSAIDLEDVPTGTGWGDDLAWTDDLAM